MGGKECFHLFAMVFFIRIGESRIQQTSSYRSVSFFIGTYVCLYIQNLLMS